MHRAKESLQIYEFAAFVLHCGEMGIFRQLWLVSATRQACQCRYSRRRGRIACKCAEPAHLLFCVTGCESVSDMVCALSYPLVLYYLMLPNYNVTALLSKEKSNGWLLVTVSTAYSWLPIVQEEGVSSD